MSFHLQKGFRHLEKKWGEKWFDHSALRDMSCRDGTHCLAILSP